MHPLPQLPPSIPSPGSCNMFNGCLVSNRSDRVFRPSLKASMANQGIAGSFNTSLMLRILFARVDEYDHGLAEEHDGDLNVALILLSGSFLSKIRLGGVIPLRRARNPVVRNGKASPEHIKEFSLHPPWFKPPLPA